MIIDSHIHLNAFDRTYDEAYKALLADMNNFGVDKSVIIPDNVVGSGCSDIKTALKYASDKILIIGSPNILEPVDGELEYLDGLLLQKKIIGLKLFPGHDYFYANDERCDKYFELCMKYDVPMIFHTGVGVKKGTGKYNDPKLIVEVAKKYPELKIVIAHYFWPKMDYCYEMTRGYPNIYFDTSGMADPEVVEATAGIEKVREILEKTIADREDSVIFGTDYPECDTKLHIDLVNSLKISDQQKAGILYLNAIKLLKIKG